MIRRAIGALGLGLMLTVTMAAHGGSVLFVDDGAPADGDGTTWSTAYRFLQNALAFAADPPNGITEIHVAQGTYRPDRDELNPLGTGDRQATFQLLNGVALMGGYAGFGAPDPDERDIELYETILTGDLLGDDGPDFANNDENSYHVTTGSGTNDSAVLDGFTITAGNASETVFPDSSGAGFMNSLGRPRLVNCTFRGNHANEQTGQGGGVYSECSVNGLCLSVTNCTFQDNVAGLEGGGVYVADGWSEFIQCVFEANASNVAGGGLFIESSTAALDDCIFQENNALIGGAIYAHNLLANRFLTITDTTFDTNSAVSGGGSFVIGFVNAYFVGCSYLNNTAFLDGAGATVRTGTSTFSFCTFRENSSGDRAGGTLIDKGQASFSGCQFIDNSTGTDGAALYVLAAEALLVQCTFSENAAVDRGGGGIYGVQAVLDLHLCVFTGNIAAELGGAMTLESTMLSLAGCAFEANETSSAYGDRAGGISAADSTLVATDSTFDSNVGGGLFLRSTGADLVRCALVNNVGPGIEATGQAEEDMTFVDCVFRANLARGAKLGVGDLTLVNCVFAGNTTTTNGGGLVCSTSGITTLTNCLFVANHAGTMGGAISVLQSPIELYGCTIANNTANVVTGGLRSGTLNTPVLRNCILWGNADSGGMDQDAQFDSLFGSISLEYSCVQGLEEPFINQPGNINDDPLFIDPDGPDDIPGTEDDNLRLRIGSPCIDAADNTAVPQGTTTDLDGNPRLVDDPCAEDTGFGDPPIVDMGPYEFQASSGPVGDLDGDCTIGITDLLILLAAWRPCPDPPDPCPADLDDDGTVGILDLLILLSNWG